MFNQVLSRRILNCECVSQQNLGILIQHLFRKSEKDCLFLLHMPNEMIFVLKRDSNKPSDRLVIVPVILDCQLELAKQSSFRFVFIPQKCKRACLIFDADLFEGWKEIGLFLPVMKSVCKIAYEIEQLR